MSRMVLFDFDAGSVSCVEATVELGLKRLNHGTGQAIVNFERFL